MQAFQKILFPVDMSDSCTAAAPFVEALVKRFNAELTLLHVLEMPAGYVTDWYGYMALVDTDAVRGARQSELEFYLKDKFEGLKVGRLMLEGDAAREITGYAQYNGTDLIMLPTHGLGMFRSLLLGSVTAKVLHDAACPVWTGIHVEETPRASANFTNIMCAVELSETSIATMQYASKLAYDSKPSCAWCMQFPAPKPGRRNISIPTSRPSSRTRPEKPLVKCSGMPA